MRDRRWYCPCDDSELKRVGQETSPAGVCLEGHGVWLPRIVLESMGRQLMSGGWTGYTTWPATDEIGEACPECAELMTVHASQPWYRAEKCEGCRGLWIPGSVLARQRERLRHEEGLVPPDDGRFTIDLLRPAADAVGCEANAIEDLLMQCKGIWMP